LCFFYLSASGHPPPSSSCRGCKGRKSIKSKKEGKVRKATPKKKAKRETPFVISYLLFNCVQLV
jgi:hypothetical protein